MNEYEVELEEEEIEMLEKLKEEKGLSERR